jgi:DNA-binding transcriptional regulator YdaS (Cro superfamily)
MAQILSKAAFAAQLGVSRSRVSQWLAQKKLHGEALVGSGRGARIRVDIAIEQLKKNLDITQRLGMNARAKLDATNAPGTAATVDPTIEDQIKAERLEGYRRDNRRKAEEEAARGGRYVLVEDVKQQMGRISSQMLNTFEGWVNEVTSIISGKFSISQRDLQHLTRSEFRTFRVRASEALRQQAQELAELVGRLVGSRSCW